MMLRRITKHVKEQNWFAVALDFFIVVVGILLAFQITNWNEARSLRAQEALLIVNIIEDLRSDELQLTEGIDTSVINTQAANRALHDAARPLADNLVFLVDSADSFSKELTAPAWQELDPKLNSKLWQLAVARYHATHSNSAFGSLVAGGNLDLLRDAELVRRLQSYQRRWRDLEGSQDLTYRPFRNQTAFVGQKFGLSIFSEMPQAQLVALLRDNPELEGALRTLAEYSIIHSEEMLELRNVTRGLLAYLEQRQP